MLFKVKYKTVKFKKDLWLQNREERIYMVQDIIKNKLINGLNKKEVRKLFGFEFNDINSNIWSYYLGTKSSFFYTKHYLYVYFNDLGKVHKLIKK